MVTMMSILALKMVSSTSPVKMAVTILTASVMLALLVFKNIITSWLSFVLILTFSSGMMTLFVYTTSLTSNEKSKSKKGKVFKMSMITMMLMLTPNQTDKKNEDTMKMFSNKYTMVIMAMILIITLVAISSHGHHPNQTISSSF